MKGRVKVAEDWLGVASTTTDRHIGDISLCFCDALLLYVVVVIIITIYAITHQNNRIRIITAKPITDAMAELHVQATTTLNQLSIDIDYPNAHDISYNFCLTVQLYEQVIASQTSLLVYRKVFHFQQAHILITDLKYSTMYKLELTNKYGRPDNSQSKTKNANREQDMHEEDPSQEQSEIRPPRDPGQRRAVSSYSKKGNSKAKTANRNEQLCNSELLVKTLAQSNHIVNKDKAHKYLLESRKCRNIAEFINDRHGRRVNPTEVGDKRMLVIQSKLLFGEIYKYREGCRFFQNNWCMGPFYSYDPNEAQIRKT